MAARFRAVKWAQGDRLPIDEERFLELLVLVARGIIQKLTVDPGSLSPADVHAMIALLGRRRAAAPDAASGPMARGRASPRRKSPAA